MRILSRSLRLKSERRVGREVEEELKKDSEKDKGLGRGEVPRKLPSGTFCLPLDNEKMQGVWSLLFCKLLCLDYCFLVRSRELVSIFLM